MTTDPTIDILGIVRRVARSQRIISAEQMRRILREYHAQGGDLGNDCVMETSATASESCDAPAEDYIHRAVEAWVRICRGITCVSMHASHATPHGAIRHDEPGRMSPMHHCEVMFVPGSMGRSQRDYLRAKADRLLTVRIVGD
jgi:hypothetical protein